MDAEKTSENCNDYTLSAPESLGIQGNQALVANYYERTGITAEEVEAFPRITDCFEKLGGVDKVLQYLDGSDEPKAREIMRLHRLIPVADGYGRKVPVPFEALCVIAKVSKKKFLQMLVGEVCEHSDAMSNLLAASAHPDIVQKTIEVAVSDDYGASEARSILHKHRGFLPTPKTQQVNIRGNVNQDNRQTTNNNATVLIGDLEFDNEKISRAVDRFNEARVFKVEESDADDPTVAEFIDTGQ
ncbi:MAG: hypothetical protein ACREJN_21610 [Nitrospiraceae bacterium]